MSILIRGMDKPTDCGLCPFEDFGYCNAKGERNRSEEGVDADCPLIEISGYTLKNGHKVVIGYDEPKTEDTEPISLYDSQRDYDYDLALDKMDCPWK